MLIVLMVVSLPILAYEGQDGLIAHLCAIPLILYGTVGGYKSVEGLLLLIANRKRSSKQPAHIDEVGSGHLGIRDFFELLVFAHVVIGPKYLFAFQFDQFSYHLVILVSILSASIAYLNNRLGRYGAIVDKKA